jgi:hypothetical protein
MPSGPMTSSRMAPRSADRRQPSSDGWRGSVPEVVVCCVLVIGTCGAIYGYLGPGAAAVALAVWATVLLIMLRIGLPGTPVAQVVLDERWQHIPRSSFLGFWRKRGMLSDATASMVSYDFELRTTLQHLLAARLAERHGISLYADPDKARRLLLRTDREQELWFWLDPSRPAATREGRHGIPPRTLTAIIDRLERL